MSSYKTAIVIVLGTLLLAGTVPAFAGSPEDTIAAFHKALKGGDVDTATMLLHPELLIYEDGHVEKSRKEYASGHMKSDMAYSAKSKQKLLDRTSWIEGETVTVSSIYDFKTRYKRKDIHLEQTETMVLKQNEGSWQIVHIHWSSRKIKKK